MPAMAVPTKSTRHDWHLTNHASRLWSAVPSRWFLTKPIKSTNWGQKGPILITDLFSYLLLSDHRRVEQVWQKVSYEPTNKEPTARNKHWTEINEPCSHVNKSFRPPAYLTPSASKRSRVVMKIQPGPVESSPTCWAEAVWWQSIFSALELVNKQNWHVMGSKTQLLFTLKP